MNGQLDPWDDARVLAARLGSPGARLFVLIGAEQWCARCREMRSHFDALAALAPAHESWLWLDLEEHAEFVGEYLPDTLPTLIAYLDGQVLACHWHDATIGEFGALVQQLRSDQAGLAQHRSIDDPGIRDRLLLQDWAKG